MTALVFCSFCGKGQHAVQRMVEGMAGAICDECLALHARAGVQPHTDLLALTKELAHALSLARPLLECAPERFYARIDEIDAVLSRAESAGFWRKGVKAGGAA